MQITGQTLYSDSVLPGNPLVVQNWAPSWCPALICYTKNHRNKIWLTKQKKTKKNLDTSNNACLLFDTFVVTAVTEAMEMVSGSGPPINIPLRSMFCVSKTAGSSRHHTKDIIRSKSRKWAFYLWHFSYVTWNANMLTCDI